MKFVPLLVLALSLSACSRPLKRQAHVLPVFYGQVLHSATPRFIKSGDPVRYVTPEVAKPVTTQRMPDGSLKVTWLTTVRRPERLIFFASGVHPAAVPDEAIRESFDLDADIPLDDRPYVLTGFGPNTAYIRDVLDFRPLPAWIKPPVPGDFGNPE